MRAATVDVAPRSAPQDTMPPLCAAAATLCYSHRQTQHGVVAVDERRPANMFPSVMRRVAPLKTAETSRRNCALRERAATAQLQHNVAAPDGGREARRPVLLKRVLPPAGTVSCCNCADTARRRRARLLSHVTRHRPQTCCRRQGWYHAATAQIQQRQTSLPHDTASAWTDTAQHRGARTAQCRSARRSTRGAPPGAPPTCCCWQGWHNAATAQTQRDAVAPA